MAVGSRLNFLFGHRRKDVGRNITASTEPADEQPLRHSLGRLAVEDRQTDRAALPLDASLAVSAAEAVDSVPTDLAESILAAQDIPPAAGSVAHAAQPNEGTHSFKQPVSGASAPDGPGPRHPANPYPLWERSAWAGLTQVGNVEILSSEFAIGWAAAPPSSSSAHVFAVLGADVIGASLARFSRPDLDLARNEGRLNAYAYVIVFDRPVAEDQIQRVQIMSPGLSAPLPRARGLKIDRSPPLRAFLFGSPRSGTSELGATLTAVLKLPWLGEGHAAPLFAAAADALQGDVSATNGLVRFMGKERFRGVAVTAAKEAYFSMHGSASFLDKTPGVPMINAAQFIQECFPGAFSIFLWRNPVANVLSRMVKFGGSFEAHCRDWAAAMNAWAIIREKLPNYLQVRQEDMLADPNGVAHSIAAYLGAQKYADKIGASLSSGSRERTGAGVGRDCVDDTDWSAQQRSAFDGICKPALDNFLR